MADGIWMRAVGAVRYAKDQIDVRIYWNKNGLRGAVIDLPLAHIVDGFWEKLTEACDKWPHVDADGEEFLRRVETEIDLAIAADDQAPVIVREVVEADETLPPAGLPLLPVAGTQMMEIAVGLIDASPFQVGAGRGNPETDPVVSELAESVKAMGLAQPLVVRAAPGGRYELIAGHRRLSACKLAGMAFAPCVVRMVSDKEADDINFAENLQRKDLTAIEEAERVARKLASGQTREEVAAAAGKSVRWVYRRESILKLTSGWKAAAERHGLSAAFLERVGRLPEAVQNEVLQAMDSGESLFARGGNVEVLEEETEISLRKLSEAPWAHMPGDPAKCAGCADRSDARPDLFEEMDGEPRCLNKACWNKKVDEFVRSAKVLAKKTYGECIEAKANSAHLYKDEADGKYSVPVIIVDGARRGKVMWAPNKDAAAEQTGKPKKGPSKQDLERAAYIKAVAACIDGADMPDWGDGAPAVPMGALVALACGCGVNGLALVSGVYGSPLQRSLAILERIDGGGLADATALWKAAKPNVLKALDIEALGMTPTACETLEAVAKKLQAALQIPAALVDGFVAEFAPNVKGKK